MNRLHTNLEYRLGCGGDSGGVGEGRWEAVKCVFFVSGEDEYC